MNYDIKTDEIKSSEEELSNSILGYSVIFSGFIFTGIIISLFRTKEEPTLFWLLLFVMGGGVGYIIGIIYGLVVSWLSSYGIETIKESFAKPISFIMAIIAWILFGVVYGLWGILLGWIPSTLIMFIVEGLIRSFAEVISTFSIVGVCFAVIALSIKTTTYIIS